MFTLENIKDQKLVSLIKDFSEALVNEFLEIDGGTGNSSYLLIAESKREKSEHELVFYINNNLLKKE